MKKTAFFYFVLLLSVLIHSSFTKNKATTYLPTAEIYGKWTVDSSGFINNGVKGTASPPLAKNIWTFNKDGSYTATANSISGTYKLEGKKIIVKMMGMDMDYAIDKLDAKKLVLTSIISSTKSLDMRMVSYMTRVK